MAQAKPQGASAPNRRKANQSCKSFVAKVIPIASKPRLRPELVCEITGMVSCKNNNGKRVVIVQQEGDGKFLIQALHSPLETLDANTGKVNTELAWQAIAAAENLYRLHGESRHV